MPRVWTISVLALAIAVSLASTLAHSICRVDVIIIKGRVEQPPRSAIVRVQLIYPQGSGESGEATLDNGKFTLQIPFLRQSRAPKVMGSLGEKCERKPTAVVVKLMNGDQTQEFDRVSLDFKEDFKMVDRSDPTAFAPRSAIALNIIH
ncbi:MAG TPA: hypothetical protein VK473_16465 [Terriglobales bacterium]|nr:hypothetical protein [Terriglobales bacterium]